MPDVFIALEEAAAFESVSYKTLTQRIYRNPQQYKTKSQAREGGGKDQVLISTSSLSAKARKAWRAAQKVEGSEVIIDKRAQEAVPWYVTADLNQYTEANKKRFYEAVELAARVQDFIDYDGPDRTGYAERYALGLGISPQSLYRYMKNVLEANAWALKLEKEDGKSRDYFRALALCRKPKETGTFPSLTDEQKAIIENIWFDKRFAANLGTIEMLYELKGGFALARGALTPLISSVWSFTAALLANPVTWVVVGIVALIAALVLLYNKCEWFRNAVNSVINFFKETLTAVGSVAKSVFEGIGNVIGSVMDAAKATVSEKLSNIKTAYEEHGGGISGVAAAAMEAVKGWYTAGYTFIDNLTGGKLSEIRGKFSTAMSNIVQGISQKFTDARTAFSNGLNNIKNAVSGAVTWFFESGKRIVSTFANGIKSAFSSAVEAVKGGLQKIRNLLPFSDAKEGPLSTLTLSGQRTMTTYAHGLTLAGDAPAAAMNKSLQQVQGALDREPEKKIDLGGGKKDKDESSDEGGSGKGKQVIIHKLLVPVDLKKIKDLQQLLALLQEVEDYAAANEDGEPGDEDAAPAPA